MIPIIPSNRIPLLFLFLALIITFVTTRLVTARIRSGEGDLHNWSIGGVHVHHQVFGIVIMLITGCLEFTYAPGGVGTDILAAFFGIGAALTLDEFALWLRLDDVYWSAQGRESIDAVFIAVAITGLLLVGATPLDLSQADGTPRLTVTVALVVNLVLVVVTFLKGKPILGALGLMVPTLALIGAIRLAKPESQWAHRRYRSGSAR
ncbi:MAG: hypothetical protein ABR498_02250, partial [Candidatus Dormibacteria bacterium]